MENNAAEFAIRRASSHDTPAVTALLRRTLDKPDDPHYEAFLHWKHRANPFGESPAWLATDGDRIVGYRTFLRWAFVDGEGRRLRAVRAVDTATDPDYRGRGIFRRLTLTAVAELTVGDDAFVFNTPNDQSRPGYLTMGWTVARRLPVGVMPSGPNGIRSMATSRVPAALWSEPTTVGLDATEALANPRCAQGLLHHSPTNGVRTDCTLDYLRWRTSFRPLRYRLLLTSSADPSEGGVIFRLRRRGSALEAAVIEQLVPSPRVGASLIRRMLKETGADYAIGLRTGPSGGLVPLPRQGPLLTTRVLSAAPPAPSEWALTLGDIELF